MRFGVMVLCVYAGLSFAQQDPQQEALERLFSQPLTVEAFSEELLQDFPLERIDAVVQRLEGEIGELQSITKLSETQYRLDFERGNLTALIELADADPSQIEGLLFSPVTRKVKSLKPLVDDVQALPGQTALVVTKNGEALAGHNADTPLAVGQTARLSILAALVEAFHAGSIEWDSTTRLRDRDKSDPADPLANWPTSAPLTVYSLAARMLDDNDDAAADLLLRTIGRNKVEAEAPARNRPFLSSQEANVLRSNRSAREDFKSGSEAAKRQLIKEIPDGVDKKPVPFPALEVDWFYTPNEICALMERVGGYEVMSIERSGMLDENFWWHRSFISGTEPGVTNVTVRMIAPNKEDTFCISVTQNSAEGTNPQELALIVRSIGAYLAAEES